MNVIFSDADLVASYRQQRNILRAYIGVCCAFALLCLGFYLYFLSLPYNDPMQLLPKVVVCAATCAFIIFSYIFMGIKYHRARKYYKLTQKGKDMQAHLAQEWQEFTKSVSTFIGGDGQ